MHNQQANAGPVPCAPPDSRTVEGSLLGEQVVRAGGIDHIMDDGYAVHVLSEKCATTIKGVPVKWNEEFDK